MANADELLILQDITDSIQMEFRSKNMDKAFDLIQKLFTKSKEFESTYFLGVACQAKGLGFYYVNDVANAIEQYLKAQLYFEHGKDFEEIISVKSALGVLYKNTQEFKMALSVLYEAIVLSEEKNIENSVLYNNMGLLYYAQGNCVKALEYYDKAVKVERGKSGSDEGLITKYFVNIASAYLMLDEFLKAEKIFKKNFSYCERQKDYVFLMTTIKGLTKIFAEKGEIEKAENILIKGLKIAERFEFYYHAVDLSLYLADLSWKRNETKNQVDYLEKALKFSKRTNMVKELMVYDKLNEYYKQNGLIKEAYDSLSKVHEYSKYRYEKEREEKLLELQERFESEQKDKLLGQEKEFSDELKNKNHELENLNDDLKQFNHGVSHDLKEPIRLIKSQLTYLNLKVEREKASKEDNALQVALDASDRLEKMLEDLYLFSSLGKDLKQAIDVDLNEVLAIVQADLQLRVRETNTVIKVDKLPTVKGYKIMYVQLFQNLINNAIKFKKLDLDPKLHIAYKATKKWHHVEVRDNGVGIKQENVDRVFKLFSRLKETKEVEGSGVGLSIVQKIVKKMQGEISLASIYGMGTTVIVKLPKSS